MSKAKRNGGYVLVDFTGVDLWGSDPQVISGIFTAVETAFKTGKPIIAENAHCMGDAPVKVPATPIQLYGYHDIGADDQIDPNAILLYAGGHVQMRVERDGTTETITIS